MTMYWAVLLLCLVYLASPGVMSFCQWTPVEYGCIKGHNDHTYYSSSIDDCKQKCLSDHKCCSVDYGGGQCYMTHETRETISPATDFNKPCHVSGWVYTSRQDAGCSNYSATTNLEWDPVKYACIRGKNNRMMAASSIDECKVMCEEETAFLCRSVDFGASNCYMSVDTSATARTEFNEPCHVSGWQFAERFEEAVLSTSTAPMWKPAKYACIKGYNDKTVSSDSLEQCKDLCAAQIGFVCRSVDFGAGYCYMSTKTEASALEAFREPCHYGNLQYAERIGV